MDTAPIIEKWYKKIGFDSRYDQAFYDALASISIDLESSIETYNMEETDGSKNLLSYLYFCEALAEQYRQKGIPEEILLDTLSDIPRWLDTWSSLKGELYLGELHWLWRHMQMRLFKIGRLQFCMATAMKGLESVGIQQGEPVVEIHIPAAGPLSMDACTEAITQAKVFFSAYYPEYDYRCFTCESWLLDPTLHKILKPGSNIMQFQKMFTVAAAHPSDSLLGYIFPWKTTREDLPNITPENPLAAKVKELALWGETFYIGYGIIPKQAPRDCL